MECRVSVWPPLQLERRCQDEKSQRDKLNAVYLDLVEKQRTYYKTVRDFQEVLLSWPPQHGCIWVFK